MVLEAPVQEQMESSLQVSEGYAGWQKRAGCGRVTTHLVTRKQTENGT